MTRDEVKKFASLGGLPALHAELLGTLQQPTMETARLLNHHGGELSTLLGWHAKSATEGDTGKHPQKEGAGEDSSSSDSSSDSSDSDSDSDKEK